LFEFYHLSHTCSPCCFSYFSDEISHFYPGLTWDYDPLTSTSHIAEIISICHCARFIG
jgi:hypothetical protein